MIALPTGPGQARDIPSPGLVVRAARWLRDGKRVLVLARTPSEATTFLYLVDGGAEPPRRVSDLVVSDVAVAPSPDERWGAVVVPDGTVRLVSLLDGTSREVPGVQGIPRRWSSNRELWLSRSGQSMPAENTVLRVDVETGKTIEERVYRPADPGGSASRSDLELAPDNRGVAYTEGRIVGSLYLVRGLLATH
jgi:hypothetical protein